MRKVINDPENYVTEILEGIYSCYPNDLTCVEGDLRCLVAKRKVSGKVGIATGGGSGHLPLFLGYVGDGLLDGCAVGEVFQSPSSEQMLKISREIDSGAGVLYLYGNYGGDKLNFTMAAEMADMEHDIRVETVLGADDVASAGSSEAELAARRGVAGIFFLYKCAGAAAAEMMNLDEVKRVAQKAADRVRSMGVALSPCVVPRVGKSGFTLPEGEMEIGMGIHGEKGVRRGRLERADAVVDEMLERILADFSLLENDEVDVLVNGLGATPMDEQFIVARRVATVLAGRKIRVRRYFVGEYATAMEMAGFSLSLFLLDDELKRLMDRPASAPLFNHF